MCKNGKHKSKLFLKIKQIGLQAYIKLIGLVKKSMLGNFTRYCHFIGNMAATSFENIFSIEVRQVSKSNETATCLPWVHWS